MNRIVISIDNYVYALEGKYYTNNIGYDIVKRYADNFGAVNLICRMVQCSSKEQLGTHIINLPFTNITYFGVPFFNTISGLIRLYSEISKVVENAQSNCSVALARSPSVLGFIVLHRLDINTLYALEVVANPFEAIKGSKGTARIQNFVMHLLLKHYCKKACSLAFVTKRTLQTIYEINRCKGNNTNYSSVELLEEFYSDRTIKRDFFSDNSLPIRISHVSNKIAGNLKGHHEVIEVAERIKETGRKVTVVFAGDGPSVDYYRNLASLKNVDVTFMGFVEKPQLHQLLLNTDFFLFPSKSEALPRVLIEAMAVSVPCIASDVGGIPELLPSESVFNRNDVNGMANRIMELASDRRKYEEYSKQMYNTALEYKSSILAERRKVFYQQLKNLNKLSQS